MARPSPELADIFREYGGEYRSSYPLPLHHLKAMSAIQACRTAELGGHVDECLECGHQRISYNSCRNRCCPKCQYSAKERWVKAREDELLPVPYFHLVFTIPAGNLITYVSKIAVKEYAELACVSLKPKGVIAQHYISKYGMNVTGATLSIEILEIFELINKYDHG